MTDCGFNDSVYFYGISIVYVFVCTSLHFNIGTEIPGNLNKLWWKQLQNLIVAVILYLMTWGTTNIWKEKTQFICLVHFIRFLVSQKNINIYLFRFICETPFHPFWPNNILTLIKSWSYKILCKNKSSQIYIKLAELPGFS